MDFDDVVENELDWDGETELMGVRVLVTDANSREAVRDALGVWDAEVLMVICFVALCFESVTDAV